MERGSERGEVGRELHNGGVVQSGSDTGDLKYNTGDGEKDGQIQVHVYCYIFVHSLSSRVELSCVPVSVQY